MKLTLITILLLLVTLILTNPVNLDGSEFDIDIHYIDLNPEPVEPIDSRMAIILLICFGLVGLVAIGRKKRGGKRHG